MASQLDLRQLAVQRAGPSTDALRRRRNWLTRWLIPGLIVAGFIGVAAWSLGDRLRSLRPVTVTPVMLARAEVQQSGAPLFQAAGWIEPRPSAVLASALVEGVVEQMLVVEGQEVEEGEPVARLVAAEVELGMREAEVNLRLRRAERNQVQAALIAAEQNLDQPVHLEAALAESEAAHAMIDTELKNTPFLLRAAEARSTFAELDLKGKQTLGDSLAGRTLQKAKGEFDSAAASVGELKQRIVSLTTQHQFAKRKCDALRRRLELKTDEVKARDEAKANVEAAEAKVAEAELAVEKAKLKLERMVIRAPITGRVLALNAQRGARLMGLNAASQRDASTVVSLYDPKQLQVRADVRLEDVPQVVPGQPVQISTASWPQHLQGIVLAATSSADIQKNTLQVKVSIIEPPAVLKPEMLVQVTFLAPDTPEGGDGSSNRLRLLVPRELVESGEAGSAVWVADNTNGKARRTTIQLGTAGTDRLIEVTGGLTALDKLIVAGREGMSDGQRIRVTGDDTAMGAARGIPRQNKGG